MLKKSGQLCIRLNLIRLLVIEMFKCMNGLNPLYFNDMFSGKDSSYNLRDNSRLMQPKFDTKIYGYKSFKYLHVGSKFWNCLPPCVKNVNDLNLFKKNIYNWCLTGHAKNLPEQLELLELMNEYRKLRNTVTDMIKDRKRKYFTDVSNSSRTNPRSFWAELCSIIPKINIKSIPRHMSAEEFNIYFKNVPDLISSSFTGDSSLLWKGQESIYTFKFKDVRYWYLYLTRQVWIF